MLLLIKGVLVQNFNGWDEARNVVFYVHFVFNDAGNKNLALQKVIQIIKVCTSGLSCITRLNFNFNFLLF